MAEITADESTSDGPSDLAVWRAELPPCESAAGSDGEHPWLAVPIMLLGTLASAAAAIAAAGLGAGIVAILVGCFTTFDPFDLLDLMGVVGDAVVLILLAIMSLAGICIGIVLVLPKFARASRNRAEGMVFAYGLTAALIAAVLFKTIVVLLFEPETPDIFRIGLMSTVRWAWGMTTTDRVLTTIWVVVTTLLGGTLAWAAALDGRWCATCRYRPMRQKMEIAVRYSLLRRFVAACHSREPEAAANVAAERTSGPVARDGCVTLFECKQCYCGLLEARATYEQNGQRSTWLAASLALTPRERKVIEPILARGPRAPKRKRGKRRSVRAQTSESTA